jgi:hypothetical protein
MNKHDRYYIYVYEIILVDKLLLFRTVAIICYNRLQ